MKSKFRKKNVILLIIIFGISFISYYYIYLKVTYIECTDERNNVDYYQFNHKEFKWLYDKKYGNFLYTKKAKEFSKDKAYYVGNYAGQGIELGNRQDVEIFRDSGTLVFHWMFNDKPMKNVSSCKKIKKLPRIKNVL
jgi:hypothetical protein